MRIYCRLRMIDMTKRLFVLELEQGKEVTIPRLLSLRKLPYSYRFYDSLIHMVQQKTSIEKKNMLALQMSLCKHYYNQYTNTGLVQKVMSIGPFKKKNNTAMLEDLLSDDD